MNVPEMLDRIAERLEEIGKTKGEMYKACRVTSPAVSQWRSGKTRPGVDTLQRICDFLGVSYEWLTTGSGQKEKPAPSEGDGLVSEWSTAWDQATPEARAAALSVLRLGAQPPEGQA